MPSIPGHDLLRRIDAGASGEVWLARDANRVLRAVKIVYRRSYASDRTYAREYDAIAKFEPVSRTNSGLVTVLRVGKDHEAGCFFCVMEVADDIEFGQDIRPAHYTPCTLEVLLRNGSIPVADSIALGLALTDSVRDIHAHGLAHRGVKPSNILFIRDLPKLGAIGPATRFLPRPTFAGTETRLPSEGAAGPGGDIFSVGRVLYQMSTGLGFDLFPGLPDPLPDRGDATRFGLLQTVILKACDPDPTRRFQSAADLHNALLAVQRGTALPPEQATPRRTRMHQRVVVLFAPEDPRDVRLARLIAERFGGEGFEVRLDDRAGFGVKWGRRMEAEIGEADVVIPLLSEASMRDEIFLYQLDLAMRNQRLVRGLVTVPVRMALRDPLPVVLEMTVGRLPSLHWGGEVDDEELWADLIEVVDRGCRMSSARLA